MRQKNNETITKYAVRLKEQAESYDFRDNRKDRILEQLIQTTEDREMIRKAIQKQWNLNKFLEEANQRHHLKREVNERTKTHIKTMNEEARTDRMNTNRKKKKRTTDWIKHRNMSVLW